MRGDRPILKIDTQEDEGATPHARGSTPSRMDLVLLLLGYPACAGIDLRLEGEFTVSERLPRMRGDRPAKGVQNSTQEVATPHARGSTLAQVSPKRTFAGYPACAGIDLLMDKMFDAILRLPRMRGDRPRKSEGGGKRLVATPHARGSTC